MLWPTKICAWRYSGRCQANLATATEHSSASVAIPPVMGFFRRRRLDHHALTGPAAVSASNDPLHPVLGRDDVEHLSNVFPDHMHLAVAVRTGLVLDIDHHVDPRQVTGQCAAIARSLGPRRTRRLLAVGRGGLDRGLFRRDRLFDILKPK